MAAAQLCGRVFPPARTGPRVRRWVTRVTCTSPQGKRGGNRTRTPRGTTSGLNLTGPPSQGCTPGPQDWPKRSPPVRSRVACGCSQTEELRQKPEGPQRLNCPIWLWTQNVRQPLFPGSNHQLQTHRSQCTQPGRAPARARPQAPQSAPRLPQIMCDNSHKTGWAGPTEKAEGEQTTAFSPGASAASDLNLETGNHSVNRPV